MMRFFKDSDELTEVVWYKVPRDRPLFPFAHRFFSWEWEDDNRWGYRMPGTMLQGEDQGSDRIRPSLRVVTPPPFTGHFCGTEAQWQGDMRVSEQVGLGPNSFPVCCAPAAVGPPERGLGLWLDAVDVAVPPGGNVALWPAHGPTVVSGLAVTGFAAPTLFTDVPGRLRGVLFSVDSLMVPSVPFTLGLASAVYFVLYMDAFPGARAGTPLAFQGVAPLLQAFSMGSDLPLLRQSIGGPGMPLPALHNWPVPVSPILGAFRRNNPGRVFDTWRRSGGHVHTVAAGAGDALVLTGIGGYPGQPAASPVLLCEVLAYNVKPTGVEDDAILTYLSAKWGVPVT